ATPAWAVWGIGFIGGPFREAHVSLIDFFGKKELDRDAGTRGCWSVGRRRTPDGGFWRSAVLLDLDETARAVGALVVGESR
ncbi:MAG TPA: hypothetical protein VKN76_04490, partial [Kiloniellaceae bacterium]|nr:hypothetical protein [Kiloniellaceae bacterium]